MNRHGRHIVEFGILKAMNKKKEYLFTVKKAKIMKSSKQHIISLKGMLLILFISVNPFLAIAQEGSLSDLIEQARAVGIEQEILNNLQNRAQTHGISNADLMAIIQPAVSMAEQNLPYGMIFDKALEGISKRVTSGQLQPVLNSIAENSAEAAQLVDSWMNRPEIDRMLARSGNRMDHGAFRNDMIKAGSKGLMNNFDRDVLESTFESVAASSAMEHASPSGIFTAINILSDLPTAAKEPAQSARMVLNALEGGFNASELQKLPGVMSMAERRSQLPAQAVALGFTQQLQQGLPASQILNNLFNGDIGGGPPGNIIPGLNRGMPGMIGI